MNDRIYVGERLSRPARTLYLYIVRRIVRVGRLKLYLRQNKYGQCHGQC